MWGIRWVARFCALLGWIALILAVNGLALLFVGAMVGTWFGAAIDIGTSATRVLSVLVGVLVLGMILFFFWALLVSLLKLYTQGEETRKDVEELKTLTLGAPALGGGAASLAEMQMAASGLVLPSGESDDEEDEEEEEEEDKK